MRNALLVTWPNRLFGEFDRKGDPSSLLRVAGYSSRRTEWGRNNPHHFYLVVTSSVPETKERNVDV
jgi:hypothetical protein